MLRSLPVLLLATASLLAAEEPPALPPNSLWIESGRVNWNGPDLLVPPEMSAAQAVTALLTVGPGQVVWIEETRQNDETPTSFRLHLADLRRGTSRQLLGTPESLGGDAPFRVEAARLNEDGSALLLRLRLAGSGYHSEVRRITLESAPQVSLLDNVTVWDSQSADGSVQAAASWAIGESATTADAGGPERRYGVLVLSTPAQLKERHSWRVGAYDEIRPWQEPYFAAVAVAPDGSRVAYINPHGLWLYRPGGGEPTARLELALGKSLSLEGVVWAREGAGLYLTVRRGDQAQPAIYWLPTDRGYPRLVREGAERLCLWNAPGER